MENKSINNPYLALTGLSLASFLGCIDLTIVNTALPAIQNNLGASITELQWVINIFMLTLSASMVMVGKIADLSGRRWMLYFGMFIFGLSSLAAGFAPNVYYLIGLRLIQGIGMAILYTMPLALIPSLFSVSQRGKATGIINSANGFGLAIGPALGGFIVSAISWRWIFFINLPIIMLSFALCFNTLVESKSEDQENKIDWIGCALLILAIVPLVLATVQGDAWGWSSILTIGFYILGLINLILFILVENKTQFPIINFKLFANNIFISSIIANFSLAFFYTVEFFLMPLYLHNILHQSTYQIGLTLLPATAMVAILSPLVGRFLDKSGPKKILLLGFTLLIISALLQFLISNLHNIWLILFALVLFGIGFACILSPSIVAALSSVSESKTGVAIGTLGTLHNLGGAIGLAIGTAIYYMHGFNAAMGLLTVVSLAAFMVVMFGLKSQSVRQ